MAEEIHDAGNDMEILRGVAAKADFRGIQGPVLNHGFVRLVDYMGSDVSVARAARCSFNAAWRAGQNTGSDAKLIQYMIENNHGTPFEAVTFTFEIKAPIFVFRQWHRHRTWSYNELSARYQELPDEFFIPEVHTIGTQSAKNKQARLTGNPETDPEQRAEETRIYTQACAEQFRIYKWLLSRGWPRELARACLPLGTYSVMFATVNLRNLQAFLGLRLHEHAQPEIRVYADALYAMAELVAPVSMTAWNALRTRLPYEFLLKKCEDMELQASL